MAIVQRRDNSLGSVFDGALEIIKTPLSFASGIVDRTFDSVETIVKTPFNFVKDTVSGVTTKVVIVGILGVAALYFLTRPDTLSGIRGVIK